MNTTKAFEAGDQYIKFFLVMNEYLDRSSENSFLGFNRKGADIYLHFTRNKIGDFIHNTHIIKTNNIQSGKERDFLIFRPFGFHNAVTIIGEQFEAFGQLVR